MKKIIYLFILFGVFTSCEDVVEIELNESDPRLVVEASILVFENGTYSSKVRLTTSAPFYGDEIPIVSDASVIIKSNNDIFTFNYTENGVYTSNFIPNENTDYTLEIVYKNELYSATQQLISVATIDYIEQVNDAGANGDEIELKIFFTDPPNEENYYFFEGYSEKGLILDAFRDEFFDGNQIFGLYSVDELEVGDEVEFHLNGVDEQFYNFITLLFQQVESGGGPFETQPATVRGNIINENDSDNFPFGYFRISNTSGENYTIQ